DNYADQQRRQLARAAAVAQADQQAAHAVAVQADQVTQARWELEATLAALAGGIAVAIALTAAWSAACGTPAEQAYETALIGFGTALALYTIAVVIQVLVTLDDAGKHTKKSLTAVTDAYQQVINDVVANLPTRSACIGWMPTASTPPTFSSSELAAGRSSSPAPIHSTNDDQSRKNTAQSLITGLLGDRPSGQQGPQTAAVKLPALSGLEQLHQQAAAFPKTVFQQLNRPSRPLTQLHWLAAVATPTTTHETTPPDVMASNPTETTLKTIVATGPLTNRKRELRDDARSDPPASSFIKC
ncbi:MAG: hypothetical protein K2Q25_02735, partial [Mycobacteriaceae bacterium]|nr:hypothetical protein [Mycobacteriaceae bacterium]